MVVTSERTIPMKKILAGVAALAAALLAVPAGTSSAQTSASIMLLHGIPGIIS